MGSAKAQPNSVRGDLTTVPFIFDDNRIYISVSSPTGPLVWFILDAGVSDVLIDSDSAERLGLPIALTAPERGAGTGTLDIGDSRSATLVVGKTTLHLETTRIAEISKVLEPYSGRKIGGIIGGALFREHTVTIDIALHRIELRDPHRFQYPERGQVVSFEFVNGVPIAAGHITLPDGLQLRLLVDLGAKANLLLPSSRREFSRFSPNFTIGLRATLSPLTTAETVPRTMTVCDGCTSYLPFSGALRFSALSNRIEASSPAGETVMRTIPSLRWNKQSVRIIADLRRPSSEDKEVNTSDQP